MLYSDLLPVQLYYLKKPKKAEIKNIFGFIFRALIFGRVLNLQKLFIYPDSLSKRTQKYFKLVKGINYFNYEPKSFEAKVLKPFNKYGRLQVKTITNHVLRKFKVPGDFIAKEILNPLKKDKYITSSMFGSKKATAKGKELLNELNTYMQGIEQMFVELINNDADDENFVTALFEVDVYLFFIELDNVELFSQIVEKTKEIHKKQIGNHKNKLSPFIESINIDLSYFEE